jgi:hypothetical protein
MNKFLILVIATLLTTGCVSTKNIPLKSESTASLKDSELSVSKREKPGFGAMTAGKAMFGAIGAAAMISAGNKIVNDNQIEDPANYIAEQLANHIASSYQAKITTEAPLVKGSKPGDILKAKVNAPYLLDVQTINWSFAYFPSDWNNYRVIYSTKLRLINTKTKKIIAEGFCARVPEDSKTAPTYDQLLENKASRLKQELKISADHCVDELKKKVLTQS